MTAPGRRENFDHGVQSVNFNEERPLYLCFSLYRFRLAYPEMPFEHILAGDQDRVRYDRKVAQEMFLTPLNRLLNLHNGSALASSDGMKMRYQVFLLLRKIMLPFLLVRVFNSIAHSQEGIIIYCL